MELYSEHDLTLFGKNIEGIIKKIKEVVENEYTPTNKEIAEVQKIILQFAKDNKRKMYGGFGLHLAIINKKPSGSFYKPEELYTKDIDLYSPEPLKDLVALSDLLYEKGFKNTFAREALHTETYTLEVNKKAYCDFSYVPRNIYNKIPFITVDGYTVTYPYFMEIDYLRMFSDPILSGYRWEKSFERLYLLQKYYPLKRSTTKLNVTGKLPKNIYDALEQFCEKNKTIAVTGYRAYNMYVAESKIDKPHIKKLDIPYFELISTDYENDVKKVISILSEIEKGKVSIVEYYPFFTFTDFHTEVLYDGKVVAKIYKTLHNLCFANTIVGNINYGAFLFNLRTCLVNAIQERVNDDREMEQMFYDMASHLIQMRKYYFEGTDKTVFSDTIFKDFGIKCMGFTQNDKIDHDQTFKANKRVVFRYTPKETKVDLSKWTFSNSSGNKIHNEKNFKIKFEGEDIHIISKRGDEEQETEGKK